MILQYGRKRFNNCSVGIRISKFPNFDERQVPWSYVVRWDLTIWLMNPTGSSTAMTRSIEALEAAFATNYQDVKLLYPDGSRSAHELLNDETLGGVLVVQKPQYPDDSSSQMVAATVLVDDPQTLLKEFTEELMTEGGGARYGHLEPLIGFPIKQLRKRNTIYRAVQSGRAVGILGYPSVPLPLFPSALIQAPTIVQVAPRLIGQAYTDFGISWVYQYESASPLRGRPTTWL
jgi:hypothetical protein